MWTMRETVRAVAIDVGASVHAGADRTATARRDEAERFVDHPASTA